MARLGWRRSRRLPHRNGRYSSAHFALGVCGTDREILSGQYGAAPHGEARLILGHESLGKVESAPRDSGLLPGDLVVGVVRRPDPVPCVIKINPALEHRGVLLEPASILAKGWEQVERIGHRTSSWQPRTLVVTGAGPIGLLAALMGAQRGLHVHVLDRHESGVKPALVHDLGGTFHSGPIADAIESLAPDIVRECTGAPSLIREVLGRPPPGGIICLAGISSAGQTLDIDLGWLNRALVLNNHVIFGTVNANRRHYELAVLTRADPKWLSRLITRYVPLERWDEALERRPDDVKVVIQFPAG